jgi:hypothetical protein
MGMVIQETVGVAAIGIQSEAFDQGGKLAFGGVKAHLHTGRRAAVHGV